MKIRRYLGAVTVAAIATLTGFGAVGASAAAPDAPTLSDSEVGAGTTVTARGACSADPADRAESVDLQVDGITDSYDVALDSKGKYVIPIDTEYLDPGEHTVSVTCHEYLGDVDSAESTFTVLAPIESSIQIVDNNGGTLNTGDAVTMVATQTFNVDQTDYSFYVQSTADVQLSDDEPRVKFFADGAFFDLPVTLTKTSNEHGVRWEVAISGTIPAGTILTVEANGVLTAAEGSVITITDGRTGETKEVTVGAAADVTMVVTPTEGAAGINVQIDATGLKADTTYEVYFHSVPVKVGEVTSDANGEVHTSITVPTDAALGAHTISLVLNGEVIVSAPFHVVEATTAPTTEPTTEAPTTAAPPAPPAAPPAGTPGGGLANTGFEAGPLSGVAAGFILIGGGLIFASRRKTVARQH